MGNLLGIFFADFEEELRMKNSLLENF